MISAERLSDVFVDVADTLVRGFDLVEFLQNLTTHTAAVSGAEAVGVLLADQRGRLRYMAASAERARLLELFALQNEEGPCLDCFRKRSPVINSDLGETAPRWPLFAPRAIDAGFRSVHAIPMRLRDRVIGTLSLFGGESVRFDAGDVRIVQALADVATIAILQERAIERAEILTEQLQGALNSRVVIEQAKGAIARHEGTTVDEAFELLRNHARRTRGRLVDTAHAIVSDPENLPSLRSIADAED